MNTCRYWDCRLPIKTGHFLCYDHYMDLQDGLVDQCQGCASFKNSQYALCLPCSRAPQARRAPHSPTPQGGRYEVERSSAWEKRDRDSTEFWVYILKMDGQAPFYAGQTRDLRARLDEHRDNRVPSTAGRNPRLVWFDAVPSREVAAQIEVDLKRLIDTNPRELRKMAIQFRDLVREVGLMDRPGSNSEDPRRS